MYRFSNKKATGESNKYSGRGFNLICIEENNLKEVNPRLLSLIRAKIGTIADDSPSDVFAYSCTGCGALIFRNKTSVSFFHLI